MPVEINYLAVLVATIASFVIGWLWHGPLFGKPWMKLMGFTKKSIKSMKLSPGKAMTIGFISTIVMAYVLAYFVNLLSITTWSGAANFAFWVWLGLVAPIQLGKYLWEGKPFMLFVLNSAYYLVSLIVMSGIVAVWP